MNFGKNSTKDPQHDSNIEDFVIREIETLILRISG